MSIPKNTVSMIEVDQQQETEIKVKLLQVIIIGPCSSTSRASADYHKTLSHQQAKVERSNGGRGIISQVAHSVLLY